VRLTRVRLRPAWTILSGTLAWFCNTIANRSHLHYLEGSILTIVRRPALHHPSIALSLLAASASVWAQPAESARQPTKTLEEVQVKDSRDRESVGYNPAVTTVGKTTQAVRDIPNSVTVVPEQLMHDRGADTFKEALRNVAGLTFNAGEGGRVGDNITLRGFSVVGDLYLDNVRDIAQYNRETFNLESIDVLRGSASMLYGRGSAGGVINQVSKVPKTFGLNEVSASLGSYGYKRLTADINQVLATDTVLRVNALAHDAGSFRDYAHSSRQALALSITFNAGLPQQLTLAYYHLRENNLPDYGVPYLNTGTGVAQPAPVPVNTFYGLANADYERNHAGIATAAYTHKLSATGQVKAVLRKAQYDRDLWVVAPRFAAGTSAVTASTQVNRGRPARGGEEDTLTSQTDWTDVIKTAGVRHELLVGLELAREKSSRWTNTNGSANPPTTASQIANPVANALAPDANPVLSANYFASQFRYNPNSYVALTKGAYVQDTASVSAHWKLVGGLRYDHFTSDYSRTAPLASYSRTDAVWSKKIGAIYQPDDALSLYASWGTSFNPSGELYQLDAAGSNTPPELNRNIELGAKWDVADGDLAVRGALYKTEKTNERNTDVANPNVFLLSGRRHTSGVEFEVAGRVNARWEVFAAMALQRGNIDSASGQQANSQNKTPINTPDHTFSFWSTYRIDARLKVGGGVESVGKRFANTANSAELPGYQRVDLMAEYKVGFWAVQANLKNALNVDYYEGVYAGHTVPGTKRALTVQVSKRF
jgi:catecholate siderophore receptor